MTADGVPDLAAGANGDDNGGTGRGAVHVMFMNRDGTVRGTVEINDGTTNGPELSNNDGFGASIAAIGDLDGDGVPDLAAGANGDDNGGSNRGAVHVMYLDKDAGQANAAPVLGSIGAKSVDELATLSFTATATDDDNDTLEFSLGAGAPDGRLHHVRRRVLLDALGVAGRHAHHNHTSGGRQRGERLGGRHGDGKRGQPGPRAEPHRFQERQQA